MKRGTPRHPKVKALARALGIPRPWAIGILDLLWEFAGEFAPDGLIGRFPDEHIAEECDWPADRSVAELINALSVPLGPELSPWLDRDDKGRLIIHDWPDHCEDAVHSKLARARRFFANGDSPKTCKLQKSEREAADLFYSSHMRENAHDMRAKTETGSLPKPLPLPIPKPTATARAESPPQESESQGEWPKTAAAVRQFYPDADDRFLKHLVAKVIEKFISVRNRDPADEVTDEAMAQAVVACKKPNQHSAALFLTTVPQCIATWAQQEAS